MSARLLAAFCLLNLGVSFASTVTGPGGSGLVVYLRMDAKQPAGPVEFLKRELVPIMREAGYEIEWRDSQSSNRNTDADLIVVDLRGSCAIPPGRTSAGPAIQNLESLASTSVSDGHVLPFSWVSCANLNRMLGPSLQAEVPAQRDYLYGRAMARLIAHEIYHVLMNTTDHDRDGVARPCFSVNDLLAERFEFEQTTLARFRSRPTEVITASTAVSTDGASGR